jgi:hypothetical protein
MKAPFELDAVRAFVTRNAGMLREKGRADIAESLGAPNVDPPYQDLEQLEQNLPAVEEKMMAILRAAATEEALAEAACKIVDAKPGLSATGLF